MGQQVIDNKQMDLDIVYNYYNLYESTVPLCFDKYIYFCFNSLIFVK